MNIFVNGKEIKFRVQINKVSKNKFGDLYMNLSILTDKLDLGGYEAEKIEEYITKLLREEVQE